ncbi:hypothetical protein RhiirC2_116139 [Rhizophagus irregularis]|uniref:Uncharacterized protein n=1 Tax=Rhizophagus irregularis TaxID=588596 RepID=A0A2N1MR03_9GLOM|nr:hypothetical protein RhiirC2_116139 [Rhizophagus irregularis]
MSCNKFEYTRYCIVKFAISILSKIRYSYVIMQLCSCNFCILRIFRIFHNFYFPYYI